MIAKLCGILDSTSGNVATVDVQGVGYEVHATRACLARYACGDRVEIVIHTDVKENLIRLYGFEDELEKQVFLLLMRVKGIGARTSADLISKIDKRELMRIIGAGDVSRLNSIKGIGKKTAERIILELKDRIGEYVIERNSHSSLDIEVEVIDPSKEALEALQALGFSRKDAEKAVAQVHRQLDGGKLDSGGMVKEALRYI